MKNLKCILILIISLIFIYSLVFAEEKNAISSYELKEIIVTESKYPQLLKKLRIGLMQ
jgi:hypothetical protein